MLTLLLAVFVIDLFIFKPYRVAKNFEEKQIATTYYFIFDRSIVVSNSPDFIGSESSIHETFEWGLINKYWLTNSFLILVMKTNRYLIIPIDSFSDDLISLVVSKIE